MTLEDQKELARLAVIKDLQFKQLVFHSISKDNFTPLATYGLLDSTMKLVGELMDFEVEKEPIDRPLSITQFMELPDNVKGDYFNRVFHTEGSTTDYSEHDIEVFPKEEYPHMCCEVCDGWIRDIEFYRQFSKPLPYPDKFIGTSDTREPKFCSAHYADVNKTSHFILFPDMPEPEDD